MDQNNPNNRKVTLSCRVFPEQKLLIAEQAKKVDMSLAQYVEAKVLTEHNSQLEEVIQKQQLEIERLKSQLNKSVEIRNAEMEQIKLSFSEKVRSIQYQLNEDMDALTFLMTFNSPKKLNVFIEKLQRLAQKYGFKDLESVLEMSLDYTLENDKSILLLRRVNEFIKKKNK